MAETGLDDVRGQVVFGHDGAGHVAELMRGNVQVAGVAPQLLAEGVMLPGSSSVTAEQCGRRESLFRLPLPGPLDDLPQRRRHRILDPLITFGRDRKKPVGDVRFQQRTGRRNPHAGQAKHLPHPVHLRRQGVGDPLELINGGRTTLFQGRLELRSVLEGDGLDKPALAAPARYGEQVGVFYLRSPALGATA